MSLVPRTFSFDKLAFEPDKALEKNSTLQAPKEVGSGARADVKRSLHPENRELPPEVRDYLGSREKFSKDWSQPFFKIRSLWNPKEDPSLMHHPRKILAGVEGRDNEIHFLRLALRLGKQYQCQVVVAQILPNKGSPVGIRPEVIKLNQLLTKSQKGLDPTYLKKTPPSLLVEFNNDPADALMQIAHQESCSLIMVGNQSKNAAEVLALGSVSERVLKGSPCPVLVWKDPRELKGIRRVLVPIDGTPFSYPAIVQAILLCKDFGAELFLFHALADSPQQDQKVRALHQVLASMDWKNVKHDLVTQSGDVLKTLTGFCGNQKVDMVVMGTHPPHSNLSSLTRSIAVELMRSVTCPVLVVHPSL